MSVHKKYFIGSYIGTVLGILGGFAVGYFMGGSLEAGLSMAFITAVLAVLETSLSFDNAVVNATVLNQMTPLWRHRFLTWGMVIAVFGMRIIFPLAIVSIVASIGPIDALIMAATKPDDYAQIMSSVHVPISAFGGAFLLLVALKYFFDTDKDVHWFQGLEKSLTSLGRMGSIEIALTLVVLYLISKNLTDAKASQEYLTAGVFGVITFVAVDGVGALLEFSHESRQDIQRASAGMFLYLEVIDASFSFDGVIGAFAITNNLFVIALGLGVGALFVRSMTIMLVNEGTLGRYRFLEHGAFYAVMALAVVMLVAPFMHIHEVLTGLIGAGFILFAFWSSVRWNTRNPASS